MARFKLRQFWRRRGPPKAEYQQHTTSPTPKEQTPQHTTITDLPSEILEMIFAHYRDGTITCTSIAFAHPRLRHVIGGKSWTKLRGAYSQCVRHYPRLNLYSDFASLWNGTGPVQLQWLELLHKDLPEYLFCHACPILHPPVPSQEDDEGQTKVIGPSGPLADALLRISASKVASAKLWHRDSRDSACATDGLLDSREASVDGIHVTVSTDAQIRGCELIWNGSYVFTLSLANMNVYSALAHYGFNMCELYSWPASRPGPFCRAGPKCPLDEYMSLLLQPASFCRTLHRNLPNKPQHHKISK
jgi:hypothetical protein